MDTNIKKRAAVVLVNSVTGQSNDFDDQAAADNFMANVADAADWAPEADDADAPEAAAQDGEAEAAPAAAPKSRKAAKA